MSHNPKTAANWFIERGVEEDDPLTHIEVQKLLYFAHGWTLGIHRRPLHHGVWEAWRYGPVLPEVYFNLNWYRGRPITDRINAPSEPFAEDEKSIMNAVYGYRSLGTFTLVGISHSRGGPWDTVWHGKKDSNIIPNQLIQSYFSSLLRQQGVSDE